MAKRFVDSELWKKQWFCDLSPALKSFWVYIFTNCDNAGVWDMNLPLACFQIGAKITEEEIISEFNGNIVKISEKKMFIVDFVKFQYGELNPACIPHRGIFKLLDKHGIPYPYPIDRVSIGGTPQGSTLKEKEKEKEKDKDQEKDKDSLGVGGCRGVPFLKDVREYCNKHKSPIDPDLFYAHYAARGWEMPGGGPVFDWVSLLKVWELREIKKNNVELKKNSVESVYGKPLNS